MGTVGILAAFFSGLMSFFAPCVVPLLPAYLGYVTGVSLHEITHRPDRGLRTQVWLSSLFFILGFSIIFVLLGVAAATFGAFFRQHARVIQTVGGLLVMLLALQFMGIFHWSFRASQQLPLPRWAEHFKLLRAMMIGVIFATAWTPCVGPVLGIILTLAATSQAVWQGGVLLAVYAMGIAVPFLVLSMMLVSVPNLPTLVAKQSARWMKVAGGLLFVIGFLLFNNALKWISPVLTYDALNGWLFELAFRFGYRIE